MERYQKHVLDHHPDLVLISYGLNDARGGTPLAQFLGVPANYHGY